MCLNEQKMYRIYSNDNGIESHVSKSSFRNIVQKFNIGYHKPQKDKCSTCVRYENNEKTPEAVKNYKEHIRRKDLARKEKRKDKMRAQDDPKFVCIIVDMAQVTPCPKASASEFYYISKLNCFNYSVYNLGTSDGTCYLWDQTTAKRGATECASGLIHYLTKCVSSGVTTVSIWSDTCRGQNRNQLLSSMLLSVVNDQSNNITKVSQKYFESGHSQSEVDTVHSAIETAAENADIYLLNEWGNIVRLARPDQQYNVFFLGTEEVPYTAFMSTVRKE